nr:phage tail tape measure protein [Citrobacter portucalensis]
MTKKAAEDAAKATRKSGQEQKRTNDESVSSTKKAVSELQRAARARETLGIRSEREIRREIALTEASYNRLARSGVMSAREQERALRATKARVRELKQEMRGVGTLAKAANFGGNVLTVGGGIAAGAAILSQPVKKQMSYERQLSMMANTAFSDGGIEGRRAGREKLEKSIRTAITYGGGTKEGAADAMNEMLASGAFSYDTADKLLPQIMKFATASGADAKDLVTMAAKAKQTFGLTDDELPAMFNMAVAAGKAGNFELRDMAKFLGPQMALAGNAGMKGLDGLQRLLAFNEVAGITAGSSDEAGNNVVNLLAKLFSSESATRAKSITIDGKGIDLPGTLTRAMENGIDPIEAFSRLADKVTANNKQYQELQKRLAATKDKGEQDKILDSMAKILEGFGVGELVGDMQALKAILAYRNNPEYRKQVEAEIAQQRSLPEGQRAGDLDFKFISDTNDFKAEQAKSTLEFSQMDSVKKLADASGMVADAISWAGKEFPGLTTAVVGATTAIEAMTAAALTWAGIKILTGGKSGGKVGDVVSDVLETTLKKGKGFKLPGIAGGLLSIGGTATALATAISPEEDAALEGSEERWKRIRARYTQAEIDAARKKYQPWWQFGEGYSTENEEWLRRWEEDKKKDASNALPSPEQVRQNAGMATPDSVNSASKHAGQPGNQDAQRLPASPLNVTTQLVLDGQVVAEAVNKYNLQDGNRGTGGTY